MCPLITHEEPDIAVHPMQQPGHQRKGVGIELVELRQVKRNGIEFLIVDIIMHINLDT